MIKVCINVTSHALYPLPLSQTVTPSRTPSPLERDVLYGRPHMIPLTLQSISSCHHIPCWKAVKVEPFLSRDITCDSAISLELSVKQPNMSIFFHSPEKHEAFF